MPSDLTPVFIRLPRTQAAALDRLASASGLPSEVRDDEVLTLDEVAALLKVSVDAVRSRAEHGDLPARRLGDEWRFSRVAVLAWLADGDSRTARRPR